MRAVFLCPPGRIPLVVMKPQDARVGMRVKVQDHHRREALRGMTGKIVGRYGDRGHVAVDVKLSDGSGMLFWPRDLQEVTSAHLRWWRFLLEGTSTR